MTSLAPGPAHARWRYRPFQRLHQLQNHRVVLLTQPPNLSRLGFQGVGWRLISDNVTSQAQGLIRLSDRSSPDGVRLEVAHDDLVPDSDAVQTRLRQLARACGVEGAEVVSAETVAGA